MLRESRRIHRRTILKGLGVSLALPWLDGMRPATALASSAKAVATPPLRMAFLFVPNGMHMPDWKPKAEGFGFDVPYIMQPLADFRDDLLVLSGLTHDKGRANGDGPGDHARSASRRARLSSFWPREPLENSRSNTSRGSTSLPTGVVSDAHEMLFEYAQL